MKQRNDNSLKFLLRVFLASQCLGVGPLLAQTGAQRDPPPEGAGIVAGVAADQSMYTNGPAQFWCPPCVTNSPPCMLPCYLIEMTAVARFAFDVENHHPSPRTFQFSSGQQVDLEISDQNGVVVAAWSDGQTFTPEPTSFTLGPGQAMRFTLDIPLKDRQGRQLNGIYQARAFLTTSGPQPQVQATAPVVVVTLYSMAGAAPKFGVLAK